jgi:hypothetical protein
MKCSIFLIVTAIVSFGCIRNPDRAVIRIDISGQTVNQLDIEKVKDSIVLNLSDIAGDLHFIQLETKSLCLLNRPKLYIGKKYILSFENEQPVFQFDSNGNYLRTIATQGEGPEEVTRYLWAVDEVSNILYIRDEAKDHYISFDLNTGKFLGEIPIAIPGIINQFIITEPGVFAVVPYLDKSVHQDRYSVYWQNSQGEFLGGIKAPADRNLLVSERVLYQYPGYLGYYLSKSDTLYSITGHERSVSWILNPGGYNPNDQMDIGSKNIRIISLQENFILCSLFIAGESIKRGRTTATNGKLYHLFIDKGTGSVHYVSKLMADNLGQPIRPVLLNSQPDGTIFLSFNALEIKEMIAKTLSNPEIGSELRGQLQALDSQINENDNPVMLVGKIKI